MKKSNLIQQVDGLIQPHQAEVLGGVVFFIVFVGFYFYLQIKNNRLKQFLFANGYTEVNFRNSEAIYPNIKWSKNKIIIKGSSKITSKQVLDDREKWEKFFNIQILSVEDEKQKTIIYLG